MRYLNWDVLLFPEGSKVPIQEFKTCCLVTQDLEPLQSQTLAGPYVGYAVNQSPRQLPIVTCFVANLPPGFPFRVSVHSWEQPAAHRNTCSMATPEDQVYFEARVLIDGDCVAGSLFDQKFAWPVVIDTSLHLDKAGNRDSLKFPLFYQEMLTQSFWNAGENIGRVKVLVSEGIARARGNSPFERLRNIVSFSFQHAPISILEASGIAWPYPGMWYQPVQPSYNSSSSCLTEEADLDAHGHSPRRRRVSSSIDREKCGPSMPPPPAFPRPMGPPAVPAHGSDFRNTHWPPSSTMHDPFVEPGLSHYHRWLSSSEDQSMPDYSDATTSASSRNITISNSFINKPANGLSHERDPFDDMLNTSSPDKDGFSGYFAPANSRASSATTTPSLRTKPSAMAEARKASYQQEHSRAVSITLREPPLAANRQTSDVSMVSRFSEENAAFNISHDSKIQAKPSGDVKGRKEGKGNEPDLPQKGLRKASARSASQHESMEEKASKRTGENLVVSDSKRKRSVRIAPPEDRLPGSSPSRKVSKTGSHESSLTVTVGDPTGERGLARAPLRSLENVATEV